MKYIQKQAEPQEILQWKQQSNDDWQPLYARLGSDLKKTIKQALMQEQGYICCYCEQRLDPDDSHVEHFRPQSKFPLNSLDFDNLLCSCQDQIKKGEPRHCGKLKDNWFDPALLLSPLDPKCETSFQFTADGYIQPRYEQDQAAITTITKLGLDIPALRALRRQAIEPFLDESLSVEEFNLFVQKYLLPSSAGDFNPFWSSIYYLFRGR
ncbi:MULTISPECIES: retron system putative HNH endonuclease [Synechocystis]|uniref:TIGR02646 family protein n=1 Tax=Synechocystis salina LEGE 00031 TaxID=1828736 RepID=A0ABR9VMC2_9SYNC|nr:MULTISPECIES: retron system putative HNH endonuclease [Synechocystis]MBD2654864.1 TIGR02646 family protein [Synechocystis sp. FACHB-383]MBE9239734.1 TIGR02646 family protein [Synechocystis salina LEGE 00041]MBE9252469.1 TIGR02646 family protein [Synechocystis salina LEGE 00031]